MSYDIWLKDPVTGERLEAEEKHGMTGGTYVIGGTRELWLNITYNYSPYYYEAAEGDPRFLYEDRDDPECCPGGCNGGIRGIYGKTGAESIPMLRDMIERIERANKTDGMWNVTKRERPVYYDDNDEVIPEHLTFDAILRGAPHIKRKETLEYDVSEGDTGDYWADTAANAIRPLYKLIAMAQMRPDGVWDGD